MNWKDIREKLKDNDRYYEYYSEEEAESFWFTLDPKVIAWTYNFRFGVILRILYSLFGISNRYEPMPIGNRKRIVNLWKDKPNWVRYLLWRVRNPWEDFRKMYIGFSYAEDVKEVWWTKHFRWWIVKFKNIPFKIPFPYYKVNNFSGFQIMIGWKSRGILSFTVRRQGEQKNEDRRKIRK